MRKTIRDLIIADEVLTSMIPAERWNGSRSMTDTPPRPFAEIRFGGGQRGMAHIERRRLELWIHDDEGSYTLIDDVIVELKRVLDGVEHQGNLMSCKWVSDSTDLYDGGHHTNTKSSGFECIGTGA